MRWIVVGAGGLLWSFWGLLHDIGFVAQTFYAWVWWSYLVLLDGIVRIRTGSSLFGARRRLLLPILVWSATFWYLFELLNLRLQNWYYVGVFAKGNEVDVAAGTLFGAICFATVLIGIFETHDVLASLGLFDDVRMAERRLPAWMSYLIQALGMAMALVALAYPTYLAPLVWGSLSLTMDPWNYRRGARSLLSDIEKGRPAVPLRLLTAGLVCGLVWEGFNFLAPQKWIYTVTGLESLKLFEMPLLGFLGFPALALDAFSAFAVVAFWFHGNETWEAGEEARPGLVHRPSRTRTFLMSLPLHAAFWFGVSLSLVDVSTASIELRLDHLRGLSPRSVTALHEAGIHRPHHLLAALRDPRRRSALPISPAAATLLEEETELLVLKGIGYHHGALLRQVGVTTIHDLATSDSEALFSRLERAKTGEGFPALRAGMVRVWVSAARVRAVATPKPDKIPPR